MVVLDLAKNALLMCSVLEEAYGRASCLRTRLNNACDLEGKLITVFFEGADNATSRLVPINVIGFVEDYARRRWWQNQEHVLSHMKVHSGPPWSQMRHPC